MQRRMALMTSALWLLLMGTSIQQGCCQHWSYGLSPGGKRDLGSPSDMLDNLDELFPRLEKPCGVLGCAEVTPLVKIYRMDGFLGSGTDMENGRNTHKKIII